MWQGGVNENELRDKISVKLEWWKRKKDKANVCVKVEGAMQSPALLDMARRLLKVFHELCPRCPGTPSVTPGIQPRCGCSDLHWFRVSKHQDAFIEADPGLSPLFPGGTPALAIAILAAGGVPVTVTGRSILAIAKQTVEPGIVIGHMAPCTTTTASMAGGSAAHSDLLTQDVQPDNFSSARLSVPKPPPFQLPISTPPPPQLVAGIFQPSKNPSSTTSPAAGNAISPATGGPDQASTSRAGVTPASFQGFGGCDSSPPPADPPPAESSGGQSDSAGDGGNMEGAPLDPDYSVLYTQEGLEAAVEEFFPARVAAPTAVAYTVASAAEPSGRFATESPGGSERFAARGEPHGGDGGDSASGDDVAFEPNGLFAEDPYGDASTAVDGRAAGASATDDASVAQRMDTGEVAEPSSNSHSLELVKKRTHYSNPPLADCDDAAKGADGASSTDEQSTASNAQLAEAEPPPAAASSDEHRKIAETHHAVVVDLDGKRRWLSGVQSDAGEESLIELFSVMCQVGDDGNAHPDMLLAAAAKGNLAVVLIHQGKFAKAAAQYFEVLTIFRNALGETHCETLKVKANLATVLQSQGKHDQAENLMRKVLSVRRDKFGSTHFETQKAMHNLSRLLTKREKYDQGETLLNEIVSMQHDELEGDHPDELDVATTL